MQVGQTQIIFAKTIKPYMSKKHCNINTKVILSENSSLISDPKEVCEVFSSFLSMWQKE